jgi:manganese/iron transport system permease protein
VIDPYFIPVITAGVLGGASIGLLCVYVVGMRIPLIGICMAHAAMAGSVLGYLLGWSQTLCGLAGAVIASVTVSLLTQDRLKVNTDVSLAIIFSLTMGLVFLGIRLAPGPKSGVLGLMWGNLLFVSWRDVLVIAVTSVALLLFLAVFSKEMKAILFSRMLAKACGIHEGLVWALFLSLCGATLTVNLKTVGGLMIYSLMINPAAASLQLCRRYVSALVTAVAFGALSALGGFVVAYHLNLPTEACIVLFSTAVFASAVLYRHTLRKGD